jgi:glucose-6-phosphate dehydrogenase assembly protein OpcA
MSSGLIPAQPEKILRALGQVWTSLGEEERQQGKPTVLRACAMTLIVVTDEEDAESSDAVQTLIELMHAHPSRAIVLRSSPAADDGLSARVFAQCWKPFGKAQQICCEQIEVSVAPDRWSDVGLTILGIIVPDLPVVVWCRQKSVLRRSPQAAGNGLDEVLNLATKVIVDTRGVDLEQAFGVLRGWSARDRLFGDLEWTRLTSWRESLATAFEHRLELIRQGAFHEIEIGYRGASVPAAASYLAAWLQRGINANVVYHSEEGIEDGLTRVTLKSSQATIQLKRTGPTCLELRVGDQAQRVSLAGSSLFELMHEELTVLGHDAIFEAVFHQVGGK